MLTDSPSVRRALAALFALALIWGYNWVVMKRALAYMGPFQFAAARMLLAALVLFAVLIVTKRPWRPRALPQTLLIGLLQTCGFSALIMWALLAGGAGKVAVLSYTMPFWVMLLAWPLLGERLRDLQWLAAGEALAGHTCILEPWHLHGSLLRDEMALAAVVGRFTAVAGRQHRHDLVALTGGRRAGGVAGIGRGADHARGARHGTDRCGARRDRGAEHAPARDDRTHDCTRVACAFTYRSCAPILRF